MARRSPRPERARPASGIDFACPPAHDHAPAAQAGPAGGTGAPVGRAGVGGGLPQPAGERHVLVPAGPNASPRPPSSRTHRLPARGRSRASVTTPGA